MAEPQVIVPILKGEESTGGKMSALRKLYKKRMEVLLDKKIEKVAENDENITIGFTKYGNKHLRHDVFGEKSILTRADLPKLNEYFENAQYVSSADNHDRNNPDASMEKRMITRFHYFKANIDGEDVYFNVARREEPRKNRKPSVSYYLYSVVRENQG